MRPTVLVVGGGYGGITVAHALDDSCDVSLVDRKDAFVHNIACLRATVDPEWRARVFFPYGNLLNNGRVVRGIVVEADSTGVTLLSGERLVADYLILATGSTYPFPAKSDVDDTATAQEHYRAAYEAVLAAERILLLGAGPTGCEFAGEISAAWPHKQVIVVEPADDVLTGPYSPDLRRAIRSELRGRGVELLFATSLTEQPSTAVGTVGSFSVGTSRGGELTADLWFRCYGVTPVSGYLAGDLTSTRADNGLVAVTAELQVAGHHNVFALGDITAIKEPKLGSRAEQHASVIAHNIQSLANGSGELKAYTPLPAYLVLPLGPTGGATQLPNSDGILGPEQTAMMKSHDFMIDRFREHFGIDPAPSQRTVDLVSSGPES